MAFSALLIWEDLFSLFSILVRSFPEPWWASFPSRSPLSDSHMNRCSECEFSFWDEPVIQHSSSHESKAALFRDVWTWLVLVLVLMVSGSLRLQRVALLAPAFRAGAAAGWPGLRLRAASQGQDLVWPFHSSVAVNAPGAQTLSPVLFCGSVALLCPLFAPFHKPTVAVVLVARHLQCCSGGRADPGLLPPCSHTAAGGCARSWHTRDGGHPVWKQAAWCRGTVRLTQPK